MRNKDQIIIKGILAGDKKILRPFYQENIHFVQRFILRNHGNAQDVEDVFQDAMVVLYQKLRSEVFVIHGSLTTYFFGICKNIWKNRMRKNKKLLINDDQELQLATKCHIPAVDLEKNEREHVFRKHFSNLKEDQRKILHLFLDGMSMKEISSEMGCTVGHARKKKFIAKTNLIKMIENDPCYNELIAVC